MVEMRESARFAQESIGCRGAFERLWMEKFQGHIAVERHVVRAIHDSHPTGTNGLDNAITAESLANQHVGREVWSHEAWSIWSDLGHGTSKLQHSWSIRGDRRECVEEVSVLFLLDQTFSQRLGDRFGLGV